MPESEALDNACTRVVAEMVDAFHRQDWDGFARTLSAEPAFVDRRPGLHSTIQGREAIVRNNMVTVEVGGTRLSVTPLAVRGDRLALTRQVMTSDKTDDFIVEILLVDELDEDGLIQTTVAFDSSDIDAAYAEVDERFERGEGAPFAANLRLHTALVRALDSKHPEYLRDLLADDFLFVDHRPASFGELDADGWIAIQAELLSLVDEQWTRVAAFHVLTNDTHVASVVNAGRTLDGAPFEIGFVGLRTVRDGKHTRIELFPDGEVDAARERLAELTASSG